MKSNWGGYGFGQEELMALECFDVDSGEYETELYIEAERRAFYHEFWQYLRENEVNAFEY